ncbi:MAG: phosphate acetyltransferase [Gammaproteobacteria bacterium]|nr:phosphate acetyltransferase [Gammaproteobacteria bacterium]
MKTNSLYIASMEPKSGKLLISLGMMELLTRRIKKVAFFRPVIDDKRGTDRDIKLIREKYCPDMSYDECYGFETEEVKTLASQGNLKDFYEKLLTQFNCLQKKYDFVLCEGLNSSGFLASFDIKINLEIAKNLGCPFIGVINGSAQDDNDIEEEIKLAGNIIRNAGCTHFSTFVNRVEPGTIQSMETGGLVSRLSPPVFLIPEERELDRPTLADVQKGLKASCVMGSDDDLYRVVKQIKIATMTVEHFLRYIEDGDLIIVGGDRADILLASITTLSSHNYPNLSGILLTGGFTPEANMLRLLKGMVLPVPILSVPHDTFSTTQQVEKIAAVITPENHRKIALGLGIFDAHVNSDIIFNQADISVANTMTPIMFEHNLFERAKTRRMNIVLPEASDERILRAAEILLRRQVVNITLLGNSAEIRAHSASLGLDIEQATIIDPLHSDLLEHYTETFFQLRKHKGLTHEGAADAMADVSYFATMMVHKGQADGMVSGAIHTTGDTIRPAFQIIKTRPGVSVVSSVFIMCLETKVLVYGDCAVNPDPTAEQLAAISISSAETAVMFGIEPHVAMLSYSTGSSGTGKDVDKVREATQIAQQKRPDLLLDGPIQYDAAISPEVARTKLPDSKVAGNATVFIFPDLNTGNNTYKAVQRSSGAIAIGPILQGLKKPVNDLSRGCLVADIINTVAITAIQAQAISMNQDETNEGE